MTIAKKEIKIPLKALYIIVTIALVAGMAQYLFREYYYDDVVADVLQEEYGTLCTSEMSFDLADGGKTKILFMADQCGDVILQRHLDEGYVITEEKPTDVSFADRQVTLKKQ